MQLEGAVVAAGQVVVSGEPKSIQHVDGGIVTQIMVSDGDDVTLGEPLIQLDDRQLTASLRVFEQRLIEVVAKKSRLQAEKINAPEISWDDARLEKVGVSSNRQVKEEHFDLFLARKNNLHGQVAQLEEKIQQYLHQKEGTRAVAKSKMLQMDMIKEELRAKQKLLKKHLIANSSVLEVARQKENLVGQVHEHNTEISRLNNFISETEIQILQISRVFLESVLEELRVVELEIVEMTQQILTISKQLKRVKITAPVAGRVHQMKVFTIGGVIGPRDVVMQIIPQKNPFLIDIKIETQFIDEVHIGQISVVRFSAFNQRSTPELKAFVKRISANSLLDERTGIEYYRVQLDISVLELERLGKLKLVPGMPVEAFIKTRGRTALNYFTKPLIDQISKAFLEE